MDITKYKFIVMTLNDYDEDQELKHFCIYHKIYFQENCLCV